MLEPGLRWGTQHPVQEGSVPAATGGSPPSSQRQPRAWASRVSNIGRNGQTLGEVCDPTRATRLARGTGRVRGQPCPPSFHRIQGQTKEETTPVKRPRGAGDGLFLHEGCQGDRVPLGQRPGPALARLHPAPTRPSLPSPTRRGPLTLSGTVWQPGPGLQERSRGRAGQAGGWAQDWPVPPCPRLPGGAGHRAWPGVPAGPRLPSPATAQ